MAQQAHDPFPIDCKWAIKSKTLGCSIWFRILAFRNKIRFTSTWSQWGRESLGLLLVTWYFQVVFFFFSWRVYWSFPRRAATLMNFLLFPLAHPAAESGETLRAPVLPGCFVQCRLPLLLPGFCHRLNLLLRALHQGTPQPVRHALLCSFGLPPLLLLHVLLHLCLGLPHRFLE